MPAAGCWLLALGKRPAGRAIRTLSWLGPEHGSTALKTLHAQMAAEEWSAMRSARPMLPSWMARAVSEVSEGLGESAWPSLGSGHIRQTS